MELIFKEELKQEKERKIFEAYQYDECIVEYLDFEGENERILMKTDDNLESVVLFWRSSVYTYPLYHNLSKQEVYDQIRNDYNMEKIIDIYPVSSSVIVERIKK